MLIEGKTSIIIFYHHLFKLPVSNLGQVSVGGVAVLLLSDWPETQPVNLSALGLKRQKEEICNVLSFNPCGSI